jgi:hypothetical protein
MSQGSFRGVIRRIAYNYRIMCSLHCTRRDSTATSDDVASTALENWVIKKLFIFIPVTFEDSGNILKSLFAVFIDL